MRIDEKPNTSHSSGSGGGAGGGSGSVSGSVAYSWWDVQDENARLPVKEATPKELQRMLVPKVANESDVVTQEVAKAAKGAMKYMGKAMNAVAGPSGGGGGVGNMDDDLNAVRTPVICFKLVDLGKARRSLGGGSTSSAGGGVRRRAAAPRPARRAAASNASSRASAPAQPQRQQRAPAPVSAGASRVAQQRVVRPPPSATKSTPPTADLMGFNAASPAAPTAQSRLHHANSMPAMRSQPVSTPTGAKPGETKAQKLKREYAKNQAKTNRVWDDVDQRWVEKDMRNGETNAGNSAAGGSAGVKSATAGVKGISLSRSNAIGKSAGVQAAVAARVNDMEESQQKAIGELRKRETEKAKADADEDEVRKRLDGKLKTWSEEHGQKKQLRALLATLHTILWEGSAWKQLSLADVLDDSKVKRVYHKASRVVHPDKTGHLDAEKRFIAKRVFDSLTQAKVEFDDSQR